MNRALVVVDDTKQHRELLDEAGQLAAGVGADLVLVATMTEEEAESTFEAMEQIGKVEGTGFGSSDVLKAVKNLANEVGSEVLADYHVNYQVEGLYVDDGDHADAILEAANDYDVDHIFITGRRRSPTGKAIFGDTAQRVILNFDHPVTVLTG